MKGLAPSARVAKPRASAASASARGLVAACKPSEAARGGRAAPLKAAMDADAVVESTDMQMSAEEPMMTGMATLEQLVEAGAHLGHRTQQWCPKMSQYIYGVRDGMHILDLTQTVPMLLSALDAVKALGESGGDLLFVGTKRQAMPAIERAATACGQHYVNSRWLGGLMTNWNTVKQSLRTMATLEEQLAQVESGEVKVKKAEASRLARKTNKLVTNLGGIRNLDKTPQMIFVIDTNKESLAIQEAQVLKIPIVAVVDSNSNPDGIDLPIPGNDDSAKALFMYCDLVAAAYLEGKAIRDARSK
eukprot:CAMPEP_0170133426 /NCGR_PEP_ID=MMETSP0033_2-20121228/1285_1 /TAXON_ID=195969 /ORGANISM="Dolichomastix tenuilepis, Strain CCMP3274" /LENGTH=302 /DNA_ID=CAMNT_0010368907 /DNA_START=49 /DNA_END=957 /DNA_ORIENTATION=-